jgi:hypothetical protein
MAHNSLQDAETESAALPHRSFDRHPLLQRIITTHDPASGESSPTSSMTLSQIVMADDPTLDPHRHPDRPATTLGKPCGNQRSDDQTERVVIVSKMTALAISL